MKSIGRFWWLLVSALLAQTPVMALAGPADDAGAVVERWATAFNSNDVDTLVNLYAPDAIFIGTAGLALNEGGAAVRVYFARLAKSGDKVVIDNRKIIALDDSVVYVTGFYTFSAVRNGEVRKSPAGFTIVLIKRGNDWLIAHHQPAIADELSRRGVLTPGKATWHPTSVVRLLQYLQADVKPKLLGCDQQVAEG